MRGVFTLALTLFLVSTLEAQIEHTDQQSASGISADAMRIPVHSGTAAHSTWAAGVGFKASFHDGFAFYPELGPSYPENLPLQWRTTAVVVGGESLSLSPSPELHTSDWRVDWQHAGWREVYDIRANGVEQMFVIEQRPARAGDLVISGRVATRLRAVRTPRGHQKLLFVDDAGRPILEYGHAFAIDAAGRRVAAETSFDGEQIALTVDGDWLAQASFPVTVDPLTSPVLLSQLTTATIDSTDVCTELTATQARNTVTVFTRVFAANDHDVIAILSEADFSNAVPIYSDVDYPSNPVNVSVAFVAGSANRWMIACQNYDPPGLDTSIYFHDRGNLTFNSGLTIYLPYSQGHDLGGSTTGVHGILVYWAPNNNARGYAVSIDAAARQAGNPYDLGPNPASYQRMAPRVNQTATNNQGWLVVWQESNNALPGSTWYLQGMRIGPTGTMLATAPMLISPGDNLTQPTVAGSTFQDYMITYVRSTGTVSSLQAAKLAWGLGQAAPTVDTAATIAMGTILTTIDNGSLAYDHVTGGFFAATYTTMNAGTSSTTNARIARLSRNGFVVESATLFSVAGFHAVAPSVTYAFPEQTFPAVYGTDETNRPLRGRDLLYPAGAVVTHYGTACGAAVIDSDRPLAGNQNFRVYLAGAAPNSLNVLFAGFGQASLPLDFLGMIGCVGWIDLNALVLLSGVANASGGNTIAVPLPDNPALTGDLYFQFVHTDPAANPAGLLATGGLHAQVQ